MFAPTGTPQTIVDKIAADIKSRCRPGGYEADADRPGCHARSTTPSELKAIIERDRVPCYGKVITDRSIKVE